MPRAVNPKALDTAPSNGARDLTGEFDVLKQPMPPLPITYTRAHIGIHCSTAGGVEKAAERAYRLGCNAMQIFSSSPRMWRASSPAISQCIEFCRLAAEYDIDPVVIHTSYLVNMCSKTPEFLEKSVAAFRGEVQRALALSAKYLVLHPGSFSGGTREEGLQCAVESIERAVEGIDLAGKNFKILIENTAGAEYSLGGSFEQVAELLRRLKKVVPSAACIDTCHTHVAGYDIVSEAGFADTMQQLEKTIKLENVPVWHCNDAKAARGSKLDRHQNIGQGTIGIETFRRLVNDPRTKGATFIAETPVDVPGDDRMNVEALKALVV
jgi:deoxyribonuclease IV